MKSDRRTLIVGIVLIVFLAINAPLKGLFLFGPRLLVGQISLSGIGLVSTPDEDSSINLNAWSIRLPAKSGPSRDEQLGFLILNLEGNWNQASNENKVSVAPLEEYCLSHPTDFIAKAHLLRRAFNLTSLNHVREKNLARELCVRMAGIAADCALNDPNNWYWRERQVHFWTTIGDIKMATKVLSASPFPNKFEDYLSDELHCKEAVLFGVYRDLPHSAIYELWAGTQFYHLSTLGQLVELEKNSQDSLGVRLATIQFGQVLVHESPHAIAGLAGIRYIRFGLWKTLRIGHEFRGVVDKTEEGKIEGLYQSRLSNRSWNEAIKFANNNTNPFLFEPDENLPALYIGQKGPILIASGIICAFFAIVFLTCIKFKLPSISNDVLAWLTLLIALTTQGYFWDQWHSLAAISLANSFLGSLLVSLSIIGLIQIWRGDFYMKWRYVLLLLAGTAVGFCTPIWQASSIIFMLAFVLQRGKSSLGSWTTAVTVLLISYHSILNISFQVSTAGVLLGFLGSIAIISLVANKEPNPDHPRLGALTVGLGAIVVGCFLFAQYDNALNSALKSELDNNARYRTEINKI